jgi:high-affinity nickel-transport protein
MIELSALWLMFVLGLRHGLDPDHVAVIDNIVFRTVDARPRLALWTGTLFALGHSLSVATIAVGVSLVADAFTMPQWVAGFIDATVVALLLLVGTMNLSALLRHHDYTPVGWRTRLVPRRLRESTHPIAIVGVGVVFGLVFDTATQAAAWGAAATANGGTSAALRRKRPTI